MTKSSTLIVFCDCTSRRFTPKYVYNKIEFLKKPCRKFGALVNSSAKQAILTPIYDSKKKIDVSLAILFIAPIKKTNCKHFANNIEFHLIMQTSTV